MSLGIFRSIRGSYRSRPKMAAKIIHAANVELARRGLPPYTDPDPDEGRLRRLACGNAGASIFGALEERAAHAGLPWTLGALRGERLVALPIVFPGIFSGSLRRPLFVFPTEFQEFCSVQTLHDELLVLAPHLRIPLTNGAVPQEIADRLADCEALPGEDIETARELEDERVLWLDLYLASLYSREDQTPVVIA